MLARSSKTGASRFHFCSDSFHPNETPGMEKGWIFWVATLGGANTPRVFFWDWEDDAVCVFPFPVFFFGWCRKKSVFLLFLAGKFTSFFLYLLRMMDSRKTKLSCKKKIGSCQLYIVFLVLVIEVMIMRRFTVVSGIGWKDVYSK